MPSFVNSLSKIALTLGAICLMLSCKRNSIYQGEGVDFLQGNWIQESVPYQDSLLQYQLHEFRFTCDSVYIKIQQYARARTIPEECYNNGNWEEYAKGVYLIRNDSLLIEATYTYQDGKQKLRGCYHIGQYLDHFKIQKQTRDSLALMSKNSHIPIRLRKTSTTTCSPQKAF